MNIKIINNISFYGKKNSKKSKQKDNSFENVKKSLELSQELAKYMGSKKIQNRLERIPEGDKVFINVADIDVENGQYIVSNPEIIYCQSYNEPNNKNREILTFEVDTQKGLDKKAIKNWLDSIIDKFKK